MGSAARNLRDLERELRKSSDQIFKYHVTPSKNDFSTWVKEVVGDAALSDALKAAKSAKDAADKVQKRVMELETAANKLAGAAVKAAKRGAKK